MHANIKKSWLVPAVIALPIVVTPALAYEITDELSLDVQLSGVYQYADFDDGVELSDTGRATAVLDMGLNFQPTERDEFNIAFSFATGNALNAVNPFTLAPYADDLEDDLEDINGRSRDYLLEAWYKHTFPLADANDLGVTLGIIDATGYLDDNAYANDENAQFLNDVFVNNPLANLPSYDGGGVVEWDAGPLTVRGLVMNSQTEEERDFNYYGLQVGYSLDTAVGEGTYRLYGYITDDEFFDEQADDREPLQGIGVSLDQALGDTFGLFARVAWQDDAAVVDHDQLYSAGVQLNGALWGRDEDAAGLGYAYLAGADSGDIDQTQALEGYVRFQISEYSDASLSLQYLQDELDEGEDQEGWIYGMRVNAYF